MYKVHNIDPEEVYRPEVTKEECFGLKELYLQTLILSFYVIINSNINECFASIFVGFEWTIKSYCAFWIKYRQEQVMVLAEKFTEVLENFSTRLNEQWINVTKPRSG